MRGDLRYNGISQAGSFLFGRKCAAPFASGLVSSSDFTDLADLVGCTVRNSRALPKVTRNLVHRSSNSCTAISFLSSVSLLLRRSLFLSTFHSKSEAPSHLLRLAVKRSSSPERMLIRSLSLRALSFVDP